MLGSRFSRGWGNCPFHFVCNCFRHLHLEYLGRLGTMKILIDRTQRFLHTAYKYFESGQEQVSLGEASRRARICAECPLNGADNHRGPCPECFARRAMEWMVGGWNKRKGKEEPGNIPVEKLPDQEKLKYCGACGCNIQLKVFLPLGTIDNSGVDYPEHCWQVTDNPAEG